MEAIASQCLAAASRSNWEACNDELSALRSRVDVAIAFFVRFYLDLLKTSKTKHALLKTVDAVAMSIVEWFPASKTPVEFLLLRSEDQDSRKFLPVIVVGRQIADGTTH